MSRYVCIHGHFYQPPRENPWLEAIELQDSAYPYPNWNERITAECYAPNAASRILDNNKKIIDIVNNYATISFNFGPTLLQWLEIHSPEVYQLILDADRKSQEKFSGHGSAIAQAYNHMIMPLANDRDKRTQVIWGVKDFEHRFKRKPDGMWLPETAVDLATLEVLAELNISFTILSPYQAKKIRKIEQEYWIDVKDARIDPRHPYLCVLPSGKKIILFFYDGPIARDVAFGNLLSSGENFAHRLLGQFSEKSKDSLLVHTATDGETYGHHHKFSNMALSYLTYYIEKNNLAKMTIYAEYLEKNPPVFEVEIFENTSWSCAHGVGRWQTDCSCSISQNPGWNQKWRVGLRETMNWLRDQLALFYEEKMKEFVNDPWAMRNDYIDVILDRSSSTNLDRFLAKYVTKNISGEEKTRILKLLEMQRHAMLMFTSCGWFFDDISGIETVQIIQYAARSMQLARDLGGADLEPEYMRLIESAVSNVAEMQNGRKIYERFVKPAVIDLLHVGAHYAISSLFEEYPQKATIYSYTVDRQRYDQEKLGKKSLVTGKLHIRSNITFGDKLVDFAVIHPGDHSLKVGVREHTSDEALNKMSAEFKNAFLDNKLSDASDLLNLYFKEHTYSLWDLFKNEQDKAMNKIYEDTVETIEGHLREIYNYYYPLTQMRKDVRISLPKALSMSIGFILTRDICDVLEKPDLDLEKLEKLSGEIARWSFKRDKDSIGLIASQRINEFVGKLPDNPNGIVLLEKIVTIFKILDPLSLQLDLWKAQNIYFGLGKKIYKDAHAKAQSGDRAAADWIELFDKLGNYLQVNVNS